MLPCGQPPPLMKHLLWTVLKVISGNSRCRLWNWSSLMLWFSHMKSRYTLLCSKWPNTHTHTFDPTCLSGHLYSDFPTQKAMHLVKCFGLWLLFFCLSYGQSIIFVFSKVYANKHFFFFWVLQWNSVTFSPWMTWVDLFWVAFNLPCITTLLCCGLLRLWMLTPHLSMSEDCLFYLFAVYPCVTHNPSSMKCCVND